jgi:Uma2 family endonuclease
MATRLQRIPLPRGKRQLLRGVSWKTYESLLADYADHRHVFLTYYRGVLEIMSPSYDHDAGSRLLLLLVHEMGVGLGLAFRTAGSTTLRRRDLKMGLEADESFYFRNEGAIRGKRGIDLNVDPPPDLAIEVEVSRRLGVRSTIYAELGVPELWKWKDDHLSVRLLQADGAYVPSIISPTFRQVPLSDIDRFVVLGFTESQTTWTLKVREWIGTLPQP